MYRQINDPPLPNPAFEIGFDHFRFGLPLDIARFQDKHRKAIRDGYDAASMQMVSKKKPDMFEKKLLSIQSRALTKGLEVSIRVQDLQLSLKNTKGRCPITLLPFTFATNEDSDWSVDRIDNDKGYAPDNIVIISSRANRAKDNMGLSEIIKIALSGPPPDSLLNEIEWLTAAEFFYRCLEVKRPVSFCQILSDQPDLIDFAVFDSLLKPASSSCNPVLKALTKYVHKKDIETPAKLARKRLLKMGLGPDVLYGSQKLVSYIFWFREIVVANHKEFDPLLVASLFDRGRL